MYYALLALTTFIKLVSLGCFSSEVVDELFRPFLSEFIQNGGNPWDVFHAQGRDDAFPYPPAMLYSLALVTWPFFALGIQNGILGSIAIKIPVFLADLAIAGTLTKLFPKNKRIIFLYYFCCPAVFLSSYMHGQLDLIPTAFLFAAFAFLIKGRLPWAIILAGLALASKGHTIVALPLMAAYTYKRGWGLPRTLMVLCLPVAIYFGISAPYFIDTSKDQILLGCFEHHTGVPFRKKVGRRDSEVDSNRKTEDHESSWQTPASFVGIGCH